METSLFFSGQNSHRFALPIRQFSNRSDLLYVTYTRNVPILRTFFITEFREPAAPQNLFKKTSKFSSGKVKVFQWKSQTFPVEKSNFSSRKAKLFQWKSQTFPVEKSNFSSGKAKLFQRKSQTGKCWDALTVLWRWRRLGWSRQLHTISTTSGRGGRPLDTSGSLRNREVNFGFNGACGFGRARTCDEEASSGMGTVSRCAAARASLADA